MTENRSFNEYFKNFGDFAKAPGDFFKNFGEFAKFPSFDFNGLFSTQRRNMEALTTASQIASEGIKEIYRRNADVMRHTTEQLLKASREQATGGSPEANTTKMANYAKQAFEDLLNHLHETSEMATKSGREAFNVISEHTSKTLEDIGKAATNATKKKS